MKKENTAIRLKKIMADRNLRQVDILNLAAPYCDMYGVKMNKSDISQYCAGKTEPNQNKLFVLGKALGVSEAWLMGHDVPMNRSADTKIEDRSNSDIIAFEITGRSLQYSPMILDTICKSFGELSAGKDGEMNLNVGDVIKDSNLSYEDKAFAIKSIIDIILFDVKKNEISIFYKPEENIFETQVDKLNNIAKRLNEAGLNKVIDYASDLSNVENYVNDIFKNKIVHLSNKGEPQHLIPDAAHRRTDIEVTDEMKKHDDDLMHNEDLWK